MAVVHKKFDGPYGYKLCEPFADDMERSKQAAVTEVDEEVTCKWCKMKVEGKVRTVKRKVKV